MAQVIYYGNGNTGGSPPTDTTTYAPNAPWTVAGPGSLSLGSRPFFYWNTKADGTGSIFFSGSNTFPNQTTNLNLYAVWGVTTGLTNGGVTTHFNFFYDATLGGPGGSSLHASIRCSRPVQTASRSLKMISIGCRRSLPEST